MQLILNSETELGLNRKMSALDEESLDEKLVYDDINDIKNGDIPSMQKELILDCIDENLTNVETICHNNDNKYIAEMENNKFVSNMVVENLENKIFATNSTNDTVTVTDTLSEETHKNNSPEKLKYNMVCENIEQTLESQKSIIDDENMDLVLQKEAEILDDQECVEDLISLAKEISESNEKINIDSNIEERSALEITNTDTLAEENISVLNQNNKQNKDPLKEISQKKNDLEVEISIKDGTKITTDEIKKNTELEDEQKINYPNENIDKVETESDNNQNSCTEFKCNDIKKAFYIEQDNDSVEKDKCSENVFDNPTKVLSPKTEVTKEETDVLIKEDTNNDKKHIELDTEKEIKTFEKNTSNILDDLSQNSNQLIKEELIVADETNIEDEDIKNKSKYVNNQKPYNETVIIAEDTNTEKKNIEGVSNNVNDLKPNDDSVTENAKDLQKKIDIESANLLNQVNTDKMEVSDETLGSNDVLIESVIPTTTSTKEKCENKTKDVSDLDSEVAKDVVDVEKKIKLQDKDEHNSQKFEKKLPIPNQEKKDEDVGILNIGKEEENLSITIQEKKEEGAGNLNTEKGADDNLSDNNIDEPMELDTTVNSDTVILKSPTCTKQVPKLCRLTNNLDILSDDDDDDHNIKQNSKPESIPAEKGSIPVEKKMAIDEDDIMIIDEDTNGSKKNTNEIETGSEKVEAEKQISVTVAEDSKNLMEPLVKENDHNKTTGDIKEAEAPAVGEMIVQPEISEKSLEHENKKSKSQKPLLSENFLSTCKKNFAHMTRDDLEEFCILKIVESVVDRSSLSEIKSKIKIMSQNLEEYKKKAMTLTKQNRDLQVVLKSVQEEQKKRTGAPITPLKITRSVGMQILMTEPSRRKGAGGILIPVTVSNGNTNNSIITNNSNTRQLRNTTNQNQRTPKTNNVQQIPVPRLVPASNNLATKTPSTANTNNGKTNSPSPIPNGIKTPTPTQKPAEKRAYNRISLSPSSVTVDLTDDEPPLKVTARSPTVAPVRLVPPQNLMAPQRPQFGQVNSPRKVYIPISGPQGNVRPGQSIMLKSLPPQGPRARGPGPGAVVRPPQSGMRRAQGVRHPAPLPDAMKQYQPPNWKALPPAPDLKLSKVENGIVISWKIEGYQEDSYEEIASYQLYAYQETSSPPSTALWKKIGDVKALPLPMACTLTQFMAGYKYYFAVRAVDVRSRVGPFSLPGSILLLSKT